MPKKKETELFDVPEPADEPADEPEPVEKLSEEEPKNEVVEEVEPKKREPKKRAKRVLSDAEKERRLANLKRGRETSLANRRKAAALKKKEKEEKEAEKDNELKEYLDAKTRKMDVMAENKRLRMELEKMKKEPRRSKPVEKMESIEEESPPPVTKPVTKPATPPPAREPSPPPQPPKPVKIDRRPTIFHGTSFDLKSIKRL